MSLQFWQQGSRPLHQETLPLALWTLATVTNVWTHPIRPWAPTPQAPLLHLRVVEEHLMAPDLGPLSHKSRATLVEGILVITVALWAAATLPKTCYPPPPHLLLFHLLSVDTKCLDTQRMHRNLQCIIEVALYTPQPYHTVPMSRRATPHSPVLEGQGHTWCTTAQCLRHLLPRSTISPPCQTEIGSVTETQVGATAREVLVLEGHLITTSRTQILPQSTIPITPTTTQTAGMTGGTGETAWAPGQVTTATRDIATTTILTTTMAAAVAAEGAATTETEIEIETVTTLIALTPDTIPTHTTLPLTACLLPLHLTLHTPPPKSLPQPPLKDWMFPHVQGAQASQREALCLR